MNGISKALEQQQRIEIRERLLKGGCLLDTEEREPSPVFIEQEGGVGESMLFLVRNIQAACYFPIRLWTDVARGVHIRGIEVQLPFGEFCFDESYFGEGPMYRFPDGPEFERELVINHKFPGLLSARTPWSGLLLGVAFTTLPESIKGHALGRVTVFDYLGRTASTDIDFMVEPRQPSSKTQATLRESVFAPLDSEHVRSSLKERKLPRITSKRNQL